MNYSVDAFRKYETEYGAILDEIVESTLCHTAKQAVREAYRLYLLGGFDSIYISYIGGKVDGVERYYNAREGIAPVGCNWVREFDSGYEVD